jgi:hypothetical protein
MTQKFVEHLSKHGLSYGTNEEFDFRLSIFAEKDAEIQRINSDQANTFTVGHNFLSTWTKDETSRLMGYKGPKNISDEKVVELSEENL